MHFIVLNGAAGSGKDTLGEILRTHLASAGYNVIWGRLKDVLYRATFKRYNLPDYDDWVNLCNDTVLKNKPLDMLKGQSPRQALIYESEHIIKVLKGEYGVVRDWISLLYEQYTKDEVSKSVIVFTDGGFQSETDWLRQVGLDYMECLIVRLLRKGHNFDGDSRSYLRAPNYIFSNNSDLDNLELIASIIVDDINIKEGKMKKGFIPPKTPLKKRLRALLATSLMVRDGEIKLYEFGIAYRCNLNVETGRKW